MAVLIPIWKVGIFMVFFYLLGVITVKLSDRNDKGTS